MKFNEKIKELRTSKNLTQEELAKELFVTRNAVSKWENDKGYPNLDSLNLISKFFEISIDDLLSNEDLKIISIENKQNTINVQNYLLDIILFILSLIASIAVPCLMFNVDPTSGMAYFIFIGPLLFMLEGILFGWLAKSYIHPTITIIIATIPALLYLEQNHIAMGFIEVVYAGLFIVVFLLTKLFREKRIRISNVVIWIAFFITIALFLSLMIIGLVDDIKHENKVMGTIIMYIMIFIVPLALEFGFIIRNKKEKMQL